MSKQRLKYVPPVPIQLFDNASEVSENAPQTSDANEANNTNHEPESLRENTVSWATDVKVGDCTIVKGNNGQRFAVWNVSIESSNGANMHILKRYSELDELRNNIIGSFPNRINEVPNLPPKKIFGNLKTDFLIKRRKGIEYFLSCVLLNPVLANSDIVKKFITKY